MWTPHATSQHGGPEPRPQSETETERERERALWVGLFIYSWPPMFYLTHKSHFISSLHSCRHEQTCTSQISFVFTVSQLKVRDMNRRVHIHICALAIYNSGGTENTLLWSDNINISNLPQSLIPTHQRERAGGEKESERERERERESE